MLRVLGRSLWASSDNAGVDITVEYGIADPCPHDKNYVDPLYDWNLAARPDEASRYNDSFGNAVYLQLDGGTASGSVLASDFRDIAEECVTDEEQASGNVGNVMDMNDAGDDRDCNKAKDHS